MPLWKTPNVSEQPSLTLIRWRVLEISSGQCKGQRHLNGFCLENWEGVSPHRNATEFRHVAATNLSGWAKMYVEPPA